MRDDVYLTPTKTDVAGNGGEGGGKVEAKVTKKAPAKRKLAKVTDLDDSVSLPTTARGLKKVFRICDRV